MNLKKLRLSLIFYRTLLLAFMITLIFLAAQVFTLAAFAVKHAQFVKYFEEKDFARANILESYNKPIQELLNELCLKLKNSEERKKCKNVKIQVVRTNLLVAPGFLYVYPGLLDKIFVETISLDYFSKQELKTALAHELGHLFPEQYDQTVADFYAMRLVGKENAINYLKAVGRVLKENYIRPEQEAQNAVAFRIVALNLLGDG